MEFKNEQQNLNLELNGWDGFTDTIYQPIPAKTIRNTTLASFGSSLREYGGEVRNWEQSLNLEFERTGVHSFFL